MPTYKLYYFDIKGRAEVARMLLAYGGIEYEDVRMSGEEWEKFKGETPFGQVPILEVDGKRIAQSAAIFNYLAKKVGLMGKDDMEAAEIDMICGACEDMVQSIVAVFKEKEEDKKAQFIKKCAEEELPKSLAAIEKYLGDKEYFVGDKLSLADIRLACDVAFFFFVNSAFDGAKYPKLGALVDKVNATPKIAAWIAKRPDTQY